MTYYTKAEKEAYKAGCKRVEKEKQGMIETLMQRIEELTQTVNSQHEMYMKEIVDNINVTNERNTLKETVDELRAANGKMLASGFDPYKRGYEVAKRKGDARAKELLEANNAMKEKLQASENERRRLERILGAFDPATVKDGEAFVFGGEDRSRTWKVKGVTRPDHVHDETNMTDKSHPRFKAGYDAGLHDSKLERQTFYDDGYSAGIDEGCKRMKKDIIDYIKG